MSDANDNFQDLKKLLKLKRHEVPPPGYFNNFSDGITARIRAGEGAGSGNYFDRLQESSPFVANLLALFQAKPGLVGALATSACLMLLFTVVVTDRSEPASEAMSPLAEVPASPTSPIVATATPVTLAEPMGGITVSSNPIVSLQPSATLFGQQNPLFQSVSYVPSSQ